MINFTDIMEHFKAYPFRPKDRITPSEQEVLKLERQIRTTLPQDLRAFLSMHAGTAFEVDAVGPCIDPRYDKDGYVAIECIYGFYSSSSNGKYLLYDIVSNYIESRNVDKFPWLPIILCPYGNQIVVSVEGSDKGALYFLDHEEFPEVDPEPTRSAGVYLVNNSFEAFLSSLRPYDELLDE